MEQLKKSLEMLDTTIDRVEAALDTRLTHIESQLQQARLEADLSGKKAKNASVVSERLDQVIDELTALLSAAADKGDTK